MKHIKKTFIVFYLIASIASIFAYKVPPSQIWLAAFISHLGPVFIGLNALFLLYFLTKKHWRTSIVFLIVSLAGIGHFNATIQLRQKDYKAIFVAPKRFKVLSYNLSSFRMPTLFSKEYYDAKQNNVALTIKNFIKINDAEIMCFQEFFDDKNSKIFNNIEDLAIQRGYNHFFSGNRAHNGTQRGLVIISKFPISASGEVFQSENGYNGACFADVVTPSNDTIRIINAHLHSMRIKAAYNQVSSNSISHLYHTSRYIMTAYKKGAIIRETQVNDLNKFIKSSPYPTILCGDLNDTPYSYTYNQLSKHVNNTFEDTGRGFDFTLNSEALYFLRIDNQFYSSGVTPLFTTPIKSFTASDHYPLESIYAIN